MNLDRNNIHIQWNEINKKKIGIGWTYFDAVAMETKKGDLIFWGISLIKLHEALQEYQPYCVAAFEGLNKFKMEDVAMVTKVQKMLN